MDRRILIIDDDAVLAEAYKRVLKRFGYEVFFARDREQGLDLLRRIRADVVIVDLKAPGKNGENLAETIQKDPAHRGVKVFCTGGPVYQKKRDSVPPSDS